MTADDVRPPILVCLLVYADGGETAPACGDKLRGLAWAADVDRVTCPALSRFGALAIALA